MQAGVRAITSLMIILVVIAPPRLRMRMVKAVLKQPKPATIEVAAHKPSKYVLMVRDSLSEMAEEWCSFDTHEELAEACDALNALYADMKYFWGKDDEPPRFDPATMSQYMSNRRSEHNVTRSERRK